MERARPGRDARVADPGPLPARIPELDGLRGLAILLVLVWHYVACQVETVPGSALAYGLATLRLTWSGVDLFFVLSGFLIAGSLLDHRGAPNLLRVFYTRRAYRILPLYAVVLGAFFVAAASPLGDLPAFAGLFGERLPAWSYATLTQNVGMAVRDSFGPEWLAPTWSVAVEEQFYLVVPLLVGYLPRRSLGGVLAGLALAAPFLRTQVEGLGSFVLAPCRADSLLLGGLLALLVRHGPFLAGVRRHPHVLRGLGLALAGLVPFVVAERDLLGTGTASWLALLYGSVLLMAVAGTEPWLGRLLRGRGLRWLGGLSYALYLLHQAVAGLLHGALRGGSPGIAGAADALVTVLALGVTVLLALASQRWLEGPLLRRGHRALYALPGRPTATGAAANASSAAT